jgi:hypothetical protein
VLSPVTGFFVTVTSVMRSIIADLTPASGRQDHTTSPYATMPFVPRKSACDNAASTASRSNVSDDGQRPSSGTGHTLKATDLGSGSREISVNQKLPRDSRASKAQRNRASIVSSAA